MASFGWFTKYGVSCDWACHRARGSLGGEDRAHPLGQPVLAPYDGVVTYGYYNDGASYVQIKYDNGYAHQAIHVQAGSRLAQGTRVSEGTRVAITGGARGMDGAGTSTGPHCHFQGHTPNGTRIPWTDVPAPASAALAGNQRRAADYVNRRIGSPSTSAAKGEGLAAGTVGNFDGWVRGENVGGNDVWFRGVSGDWFWSGGFTDKGTHDLADLNPASLGPKQRKTTTDLNGRADATTSAKVNQTLPAGTIGDFDGWKYGTKVEGEDRWARGAHSGDWFWLGGLEPRNVNNLTDLNPKTPDPEPTPTPAKNERTVAGNAVNGRTGPSTAFPIVQSLDAGTVGTFDGYAKGEKVSGVDVWFRGAINGRWFWAGAFTSQSTDGLTLITDLPEEPATANKRTPVYPKAVEGYDVPLGVNDRDPGSVIRAMFVHHTATKADQLAYFLTLNDRSSAPTWYLRTSGDVFETIRPGKRPSATGKGNTYSVAIETQNSTGEPTWEVTGAQLEALAQIAAWLHSYNGKELDGVPVEFELDREHVLGHSELPQATACPGPYLLPRLDQIVERAKVIYAADYAPAEPDDDATWLKSIWGRLLDVLLRILSGGKS